MGKFRSRTIKFDKVTYRSRLEVTVAKQLRKIKGVDVSYESKYLDYVIEGTYVPDYFIRNEDGSEFFIEVKGYLDQASQKKMIAVKKAHPDLDIRLLFSSNNPIRKGAKMRYTDWADKHGFPWAIGKVPEDWFNG